MPLPQQKFRELVIQLLYSWEMDTADEKHLIPLLMRQLSVSKKNVKEAWEIAEKIWERREDLDRELSGISKSWEFERVHAVERGVLRLGVYEMLHCDDIPPKVAITEAMRLSKKYASPESSSFVNALLDGIYKKSLGEEIDSNKLKESFEKKKEDEALPKEVSDDLG